MQFWFSVRAISIMKCKYTMNGFYSSMYYGVNWERIYQYSYRIMVNGLLHNYKTWTGKKSSQITFIHLHIRYAILSNFYSSLYRIFCLLNGLHVSRVYDRYAQMIIHLIKILNENGWVVESIKFVLFPCKKAFMSWYKRGRTWTIVLEAISVLQRHLKNCKQWLFCVHM